MAYKIVYLDGVEKDLRRLDKTAASKILNRIETHLSQSPHELGKPLTGEFRGYYRYRWGDYRVIYKIVEREILVYILRIGHRREVYE